MLNDSLIDAFLSRVLQNNDVTLAPESISSVSDTMAENSGPKCGFISLRRMLTALQRESGGPSGRVQLQRKVQLLPYSSGCCYKQVRVRLAV